MKNKLQTALAFIGAPCLGIDFYLHVHSMSEWNDTALTRICNILYMAQIKLREFFYTSSYPFYFLQGHLMWRLS
ncbi:MAG TPA: hypothetical protein VGQ09_15820 [Chitinophagaceae bacterium]|jgi:hypothetical protein|nr:hypothetical protein [Chitinophagaceae bacterium]